MIIDKIVDKITPVDPWLSKYLIRQESAFRGGLKSFGYKDGDDLREFGSSALRIFIQKSDAPNDPYKSLKKALQDPKISPEDAASLTARCIDKSFLKLDEGLLYNVEGLAGLTGMLVVDESSNPDVLTSIIKVTNEKLSEKDVLVTFDKSILVRLTDDNLKEKLLTIKVFRHPEQFKFYEQENKLPNAITDVDYRRLLGWLHDRLLNTRTPDLYKRTALMHTERLIDNYDSAASEFAANNQIHIRNCESARELLYSHDSDTA